MGQVRSKSVELQQIEACGFTIVEMMVSVLIFGFVIAGALSFFVYQSRMAMESKAAKMVGESVSSALRMINTDLLHAGSGVADPLSGSSSSYPELGVYVDSKDGIQSLYINWTGFLDYDAIPSEGLPVNSIFKNRGFMDLRTPVSVFEIRFVPDFVKPNKDIGALLVRTKGSVLVENTSIEVLEREAGTQTLLFKILDKKTGSPKIVSGQVAPAVVYKWVKNTDNPSDTGGRLFRNEVPILGDEPKGKGRLGGYKLKVTKFQVQCKFSDDDGKAAYWSPENGSTAGFNMKNLRLVRVTVDFTWKVPHLGSHRSSSSVDVAPRAMVRLGVQNAK